MDKTTLISKITEIGTCEDETQRRELLTQLQEEAGTDYDRLAQLETDNATLTQNNEDLRSANMKLFLRVGDSRKHTDDIDEPEEKPKRKFEDLFNEKGQLK